jgi:hypothetical protein
MQAQKDLREHLLQQELENLETTIRNLESLGYPVDGLWDTFKKGVSDVGKAAKNAASKVAKSMSGHKDAKYVLNKLHDDFPGTNVDKSGDVLMLTVNGKKVEVMLDDGVWMVSVGGAKYKADMDNLKQQIVHLTQPQISGSKMEQVLRCSRAVMVSQRCGFSG